MLKHTQKIKNIYEDIQRCLYYMIPEKWEKLYLYASVIDLDDGNQGGELYFYYIPKGIIKKKPVNVYEIPNKFNLNEKEYTDLVRRLYEYIKILRIEYKKSSIGEIWTNFTISIINNKFKVEFGYEDFNNSEYDSYQRHIIWRYKYLGITEDQIGNKKDREVLNYYLNGPQQILKTDVYESGIYITDIKNIIGYNTENYDSYDGYDSYANDSYNDESDDHDNHDSYYRNNKTKQQITDKFIRDSNNMNIEKDRRKNINNYTNETHKIENDWDHRKKKSKSKKVRFFNDSSYRNDGYNNENFKNETNRKNIDENNTDKKKLMRNQILFSDVELDKLRKED